MRYRLGTHKPDAEVERMNPIKIKSSGRLPDAFDARIRWPGLVTEIRDQGNCAASWAFSTTGTLLDWLQSLKQFFIDVSYHILVASLTLMALF